MKTYFKRTLNPPGASPSPFRMGGYNDRIGTRSHNSLKSYSWLLMTAGETKLRQLSFWMCTVLRKQKIKNHSVAVRKISHSSGNETAAEFLTRSHSFQSSQSVHINAPRKIDFLGPKEIINTFLERGTSFKSVCVTWSTGATVPEQKRHVSLPAIEV